MSRINDNPEEIELTRLKLFHLISILDRKTFKSFEDIVSKLLLSSTSFKGILPKTVTAKRLSNRLKSKQ